jgi:peptidoglycan/LPS O-acetylase OafA/YrhL
LTAIDDRPAASKGSVEHFDVPSPATGAAPLPAAPGKAPREGRLYVLDLLRFVAAALVVGFHLMPVAAYSFGTTPDEYWPHAVLQVSRYGWMGVELFFLISGFVICMSSWGRSLSQFVTSRVTRLWPAYVFAVVVVSAVLMIWPAPGESSPEFPQVLANLTMLQGLMGIAHVDPVYWSLLVELKFYLIFAVVVRAGLTYRRVVGFCVVWTVAALFVQASGVGVLNDLLNPTLTPYFVAGVTLYLMHRFGPNLVLWGMLATSWVLASVMLNSEITGMIQRGDHVNFTTGLVLLTAFFLVLVAVALGWFSWMRWRGLVVIGALTYPVYLLHYHLGRTAFREMRGEGPSWLLAAGVLAGLLVVAYLVHRLVERPVSAALRRGLRAAFDEIRHHSTPPGLAGTPRTSLREADAVGSDPAAPA